MAQLFDNALRAIRRDRAARTGPELFLHERVFADCLDRLALLQRTFERALLIGSPDPGWGHRLQPFAKRIEVRDPGAVFAEQAHGRQIVEDAWQPAEGAYDLVLAVGTLDTVNDLPLALRLLRHGMSNDALLLVACPGGDTLPRLRNAMRAADAVEGFAGPHVHPRIEAAALAPLLEAAGFVRPVVDVDRIEASYRSLDRLIADLRAMGVTNVLRERPRFLSKAAKGVAERQFSASGDGSRTVETFEILHCAAWTPSKG